VIFSYNPNQFIGNLDLVAVEHAKQHARDAWPEESCGAIANGQYLRFENESDDPLTTAEIKDPRWFHHYMNDDIECMVHSHNDFPLASKADQEQQIELDIPSLIINLKNQSVMDCILLGTDAPLIGRPWFYGVFDCVSLVKDYVMFNRQIELPRRPHDFEFWLTDDMFEKELRETDIKYHSVDIGNIEVGDLLFYAVGGTKNINHIAVVSGESLVLHHFLNRVSGEYPLNFQKKYIRKVIRL
jgi:proteasome lid subunit RPN8/RPN11